MSKADQELYQLANDFQTRLGLRFRRASLGDANGRIDEPGRPGYVRVRFPVQGGFSEYVTVLNKAGTNKTPGTGVIVGIDVDSDELAALRLDFQALLSQGINPTASNPADPNASYYIQQMRLVTFACHPISTSADSMLVAVQTGTVIDLDADTLTLFAGAQVDLEPYIPGGAGEWCLACIFWKTDNTLEVLTSTPKTSMNDLGIDDINECFAARTTGSLPIWAWQLYNGQTGIAAGAPANGGDDFMDLRPLWFMLQSGGTGTALAVTDGTTTVDPTTTLNFNPTYFEVSDEGGDTAGVTGSSDLGKTISALGAKFLLQQSNANLPNAQSMGALGTGLVKNATTTGVQSIATAGTDYTTPTGTENLQNKTITLSSLVASALSLLIGGFKAIFTHSNTADRTYTFPDNSGTVALTSDIPVAVTDVTASSPLASSGGTTPAISIATPISRNLLADVYKQPCRVVAVANVSVSSAPSSIDGITLASGDRILLTAQSTGSQRGIWVFNGAGSAMTRPADFASGSTTQAFFGVTVFITEGTDWTGTLFQIITTAAITIDSTTINWGLTNFLGGSYGFWNVGNFIGRLTATAITANRAWNWPNASGTVLLNDNTTTVQNKTVDSTNSITGAAINSGTVAAARLGTMSGATNAAAGASGAAPQPASGDDVNLLSGAATFVNGVIRQFAQTADVTVGNTGSELTLIGSGQGSTTLAANAFRAGRSIRIFAEGVAQRTSGNFTLRIKLGGSTIIATATAGAPVGTGADNPWQLNCALTCRTTGASGTIKGQGMMWMGGTTTSISGIPLAMTAAATIDTTGTLAIDITAQWSATATTNTITLTNLIIDLE